MRDTKANSAAAVVMPRLSDSMEKGTNESAPVGGVIARIGEPGAQPPSGSDPAPRPPRPTQGEPAASAPAQAVKTQNDGGAPEHSSNDARIKASPLARRVADELGVDISTLSGSGPGGRVVRKDVERAGTANTVASTPTASSSSPETAKGSTAVVELTTLQLVVARRMLESKATAPHFYLTAQVDMGTAVAARARIKETSGEGELVPSFNDMVVKACAIALRKFARANGAYEDGRFELYSRINVGIAVATQDALVVPTVFDADRKSLGEIAAAARLLAAKVRDGRITPAELSGATFTVSNLGKYGISSFEAIVNSPQAGILAVGEIADRPVVKNGEIVPGKLMSMTLSCDHRILYGADGAEFISEVKRLLQEPVGLAL